ncbi:Dos2-interacting transcription regulator of RNA-Pol-II-domain-containing protein [Annulohypoxylon maeteangense]|uniref:Dos2-interacting transcription regulator of RNA-Pol-II-domain-containing protein n=1 Tax=Annulohypoxylon maeteangense TaxID=1927788 RepID=UPI00200856FB|nr:Dos2-interacting transcription regulator of RNA-Pol-II-domain-containing protein [Annulohypoxylon maeteangense]KAI0889469.1 Dos2-interacting transcription regulator of RNA-Pol-II-domain-containing protein [Annulohypoxylon maeteangense]
MASVKFEDLALQYVLADENDQEREISEKAAKAIEEATNTRIALGQWVASINRWIQPSDDTAADDNIIARAKALDFLAATLGVLRKKDVSFKADQIKLLVTFFGSLFSSDHRAGVTASAKALRHLIRMKSFQPNLGDDIITSVCRLGEDFKLQTPATRLELYDLFLELLQDPAVANDLEYRHGNTCGFITSLLDLCSNERDPQNLMKWFQILGIFLQNFSPSEDVILEVFKTFSAYFPISLRATAAPSGITSDDLKSAVRSCFASHHRVASYAIPYLLNKLDQGDAVTVAVKVDILQTINACVVQYEHPKQSVVPFVDQIWSSLKYEVRNGEIPDTIKATLTVIRSITTRLDDDELRSFLSSAWRDLVDDLSNPTYIAQAGRLLVAIAGAGFQSFSMITSQAIPSIQTALKQTQSSNHKQELITLLNSILAVRSLLVNTLKDNTSVDRSTGLLKDDVFGDYLFSAVYLPLWDEVSDGKESVEQIGILKKIMEGFAVLVGQQSSNTTPSHQLCSASTCEKIFGWLAGPSIVNPLESRQFSEGITDEDANREIRDSAVAALKEAVPLYPPSFRILLQQYLTSLTKSYWHHLAPHDLPLEIKLVASTLCDVGCLGLPGKQLSLSNVVSLINVLLEALFWMVSKQAPPKYWTPFICSIHLCIIQSLDSLSNQADNSSKLKPQGITKDWFIEFTKKIVDAGAPQLDLNKAEASGLVASLVGQETEGSNTRKQLLAYSVFVVRQLYRRFTSVHHGSDKSTGDQPPIALGKDFGARHVSIADEDVCIHQLGLLATSVVRALNEDEQKALEIGKDAFTLFNEFGEDGVVPERDLSAKLAGVSLLDDLRTVPLSMGILQGLYPGVISPEHHLYALKNLCTILTSTPEPCLDTTRAALDISLAILSNKLRIEDKVNSQAKVQIQQTLVDTLTSILNKESRSKLDASTDICTFRSILYFLAGDVARFRSSPPEQNVLLKMVCDKVPLEPTLGRQLASNFQVLVSPKECLEKANHAIQKRLSGEWLYFQAVQPYLKECFPNSGLNETVTINRAVAIFAVLKHLKYEQYASDIGQIVRVGIRSLSTFDTGIEMESCLSVLLQILEKEPIQLREHLPGLISGIIIAYETAKKKPKATESEWYPTAKAQEKGRVLCRKFALEFFQKLPRTYEAQYLVPHRQKLLRPLSTACGDSVREIRRTALAARIAWDALA